MFLLRGGGGGAPARGGDRGSSRGTPYGARAPQEERGASLGGTREARETAPEEGVALGLGVHAPRPREVGGAFRVSFAHQKPRTTFVDTGFIF